MKCPRCNSTETNILQGKPPHFAQEKCELCGRWLRWLPKLEALARGFHPEQTADVHSDGEHLRSC